ncbi:MAG: aminotransferase class V-fold PLP-dependent enzyme [bacterium]
MFGKKNPKVESVNLKDSKDFDYVSSNDYYFDSACQTERPVSVIEAEKEYYTCFNACGHRVKYKWGRIVDDKVDETRELLLKLVGKSSKEYTVAFTLNTTYGINLVLSQLKSDGIQKIVTSEIEHNSCFLPTMTYARNHNIERIVLPRSEDGALEYKESDISKSIVLVNAASNIDGRELVNAEKLAKDIHNNGGVFLLDGAQTLGHIPEMFKNVDFDALFSSGHKMYGPSLGIIIIKKSLFSKMDQFFIGGGTVVDVKKESYELIKDDLEMYSSLEAGLQNFAGIIGLGEAIKWRNSFKKDGMNAHDYESKINLYMFNRLKEVPGLKIFNKKPSSVISVYTDKMDAHTLGMYFSEKNIMCRTGYFCCHYYLKDLLKMPPLLRISLGLNNDERQIDFLIETLKFLLK